MHNNIEDVRTRLKKMAEVFRETGGGFYDAFSIKFFSDGSGFVNDGAGVEQFEFITLDEFFHNSDMWILDRYPDDTIPDVYMGMDNDDIETDLASDIYDLLIGLTPRESAVPFPEIEVDLEASSVVINLAGRTATIFISVKNDDDED